jgi:hypothetical protein
MAVHAARGCRSALLAPPLRAPRSAERGTARNWRCCNCALARAADLAPPHGVPPPPAAPVRLPLVLPPAPLLWPRPATRMKFAPRRNRDDMPETRRFAWIKADAGALGSHTMPSVVAMDVIIFAATSLALRICRRSVKYLVRWQARNARLCTSSDKGVG